MQVKINLSIIKSKKLKQTMFSVAFLVEVKVVKLQGKRSFRTPRPIPNIIPQMICYIEEVLGSQNNNVTYHMTSRLGVK